MRILFDQGTPVGIRKFLIGHEVRTAYQQGWDRLENGSLLRAAEVDGFDIFLTPDQNLAYQQNLKNRKIAIVVLDKSHWPTVKPHINLIIATINTATPGSYAIIEVPE